MASFFILVAFSVSMGFAAEPATEKLAVFESEELAQQRLMGRLRDHAEDSGAVLKKVVPKPAVKTEKFTSFGVELQVLGDSKQLADFIGTIEDRDRFEVISSLEIVPDKRDGELQSAKLVLSDWYALDEASAAQVDDWRTIADVTVPGIEIYAASLIGVRLSAEPRSLDFSLSAANTVPFPHGQCLNETHRARCFGGSTGHAPTGLPHWHAD